MKRIRIFETALSEKKAIKVIAGINNFDTENVKKVVCAAEQAGAHSVDIAADAELIRIAKELTELPVFVSSVNPEKLQMAIQNGADAVEIGNYDVLYNQGMRISADEVLEITRKTRALIGNEAFLSVTVPGHISIEEQIKLAVELENFNVSLIQTEGAAVANVENTGARGLLEKANVSIANTIEIKRNTEIPVMTASGITTTTAAMAFAAGADAIGIGSCVNKLSSTIEMIAVIRSIMEKSGIERKIEELV